MDAEQPNTILIRVSACRLYGVVPCDIIFDSRLPVIDFDSPVSGSLDETDEISSDDGCVEFFSCRNKLEYWCFGCASLLFVVFDSSGAVYGHYHGEEISGADNPSLDLSVFVICRGIELIERKCDVGVFSSTAFPESELYEIERGTAWICRVSESPLRIEWNDTNVYRFLESYGIRRACEIKRLMVYRCRPREKTEHDVEEKKETNN